MTNLYFADLALLYVIRRWWRVHRHAPQKADLWQPRGGGELNVFLKPCVEAGRCSLVTSDREFQKSVRRLKETGFLLKGQRAYALPEWMDTHLFASNWLSTDWRKWPLMMTVGNSIISFEQAEYWNKE